MGFSEVFQMRFLGLKKQKWGFNQQKWLYNGIYGGDNGEMTMWILNMTYLMGDGEREMGGNIITAKFTHSLGWDFTRFSRFGGYSSEIT